MIERLNEHVMFQQQTIEPDQYGNRRTVWTDYFTCSAYADTFSKDETAPAATTNEQRQITFQCRYCSELAPVTSSEYRAIFRGDVYNILSVDMMNYRKKMLKFKCQKVER